LGEPVFRLFALAIALEFVGMPRPAEVERDPFQLP
jgi:hypothetical protein